MLIWVTLDERTLEARPSEKEADPSEKEADRPSEKEADRKRKATTLRVQQVAARAGLTEAKSAPVFK